NQLPTQDRRHGGSKGMRLVRITIIATQEQIGLLFRLGIQDPRHTVLLDVRLAGQRIDANIMGLEESTEAVVVLLTDRIILVIMAASAAQRDAEEAGRRVL